MLQYLSLHRSLKEVLLTKIMREKSENLQGLGDPGGALKIKGKAERNKVRNHGVQGKRRPANPAINKYKSSQTQA